MRMPRLTHAGFRDLAVWMIGFGALTGVAMPGFMLLVGVPRIHILTLSYLGSSICAGIGVGALSFTIARGVVGTRLRVLSRRMVQVAELVRQQTWTGQRRPWAPEESRIPVETDDELGECASAFNRLVDTLARSYDVETAIKSFSESLSETLELAPLSERVLERLRVDTGAEAGALLVVREGELDVAGHFGLSGVEQLTSSDKVQRVLRSGAPVRIEVPPGVALEAVVTSFRPHQILVVPVAFEKVAVGALVLAAGKPFPPEIDVLLSLLCPSLALALVNVLSHEALQRLSVVDPLTGLYNRRFGQRRLREEITRSSRSRAPLGLLMFDIDHFKSINDTWGHLVGDRVLKEVADAARGLLRQGDILVRFGGEEFLAVLPEIAQAQLLEVAERLRVAVAALQTADGDAIVRVAVSIGTVSFSGEGLEGPHPDNELVGRADRALYAAKSSGRNRVVSAESLAGRSSPTPPPPVRDATRSSS